MNALQQAEYDRFIKCLAEMQAMKRGELKSPPLTFAR